MNPLLTAVKQIADCEQMHIEGALADSTVCRQCGRAWATGGARRHWPSCAGAVAQAALAAWDSYDFTDDLLEHLTAELAAHRAELGTAYTARDELIMAITGAAIERCMRGEMPRLIPRKEDMKL